MMTAANDTSCNLWFQGRFNDIWKARPDRTGTSITIEQIGVEDLEQNDLVIVEADLTKYHKKQQHWCEHEWALQFDLFSVRLVGEGPGHFDMHA